MNTVLPGNTFRKFGKGRLVEATWSRYSVIRQSDDVDKKRLPTPFITLRLFFVATLIQSLVVADACGVAGEN